MRMETNLEMRQAWGGRGSLVELEKTSVMVDGGRSKMRDQTWIYQGGAQICALQTINSVLVLHLTKAVVQTNHLDKRRINKDKRRHGTKLGYIKAMAKFLN